MSIWLILILVLVAGLVYRLALRYLKKYKIL